MRVFLLDNSDTNHIMDIYSYLKNNNNDVVVFTSNHKFSDYNIQEISNVDTHSAIYCYKPDIVVLYGNLREISDNIDTLKNNKLSGVFIISVITSSNLLEEIEHLDKIMRNSIKLLCYEERLYQKIKNMPYKEIVFVEDEQTIFSNLLNNINRQNKPFEVLARSTKYGIMAYVKNDYFFIDDLITRNTVYEADIIESELKDIILKSKFIFDIGAHSGSHSMVYSFLNPDARIFSFEPQTIMYKTLKFNIDNNRRYRVNTFNVALGKEVGLLNLSKSISDGVNQNQEIDISSGKYYNLGGMQIGTDGEQTLCDILDNYDYGGCDFIKLDVEGFEGLVVQGGLNLIKKYKPIIFFECNHKTVKPEVIELLHIKLEDLNTFEILKSIGYRNFKKLPCDNYLTFYEGD